MTFDPRTFRVKPQPDFTRLKKVLTRQGRPDRVPFYELYSDIEGEVLQMLGVESLHAEFCPDETLATLRRHIDHMYWLGYDYCNIGRNWDFPKSAQPAAQTVQGQRAYVTSDVHVIGDQCDFDAYQWPDIDALDFSRFEKAAQWMPDGMKAIAPCAGILENVMALLGHESICYLLFDDPDLVRQTFDTIADCIISYLDRAASFDTVAAVTLGEDMGFKTQTMLSPDVYREYLFPLHKRLVDVVHGHGKLTILHSCGNLEAVMDDIIACGWDAKHSFEDVITPVWDAKQKWGDRIALLGGFDMDKICTMSEEQVREHTRMLIDTCAAGGGWALGTGNSVANYVPPENYLAMLDEGFVYS